MAPALTALIIAPDDFPRKYKDYDAACRAVNLEPNGHCYLVCQVTTAAGPRTLLTVDLNLLPGSYEAGTPDHASVPGTDRSEETASRAGTPGSGRYPPHPLPQGPDPRLPRHPPEAPRGPHEILSNWGQRPGRPTVPAPPRLTPEGEVQGLAVARVRFGVVRNPDARASTGAQPRGANAPGRLVVELQTARVPADRMDAFDAVVQMPRGAHTAPDETGHLAEATAAYFAQRVDDQTSTAWATPGRFDPDQVSAVLDSVRQQLQDLATRGGAPAPAAALAAGIGANLIRAPEMRLKEDISWIIDICVIGIGFATGQPHLVAGAAKHLVHTELENALEHAVSDILHDWLNPTAPAAPGRSHDDPTPAAEARHQPDSSGPYQITLADSDIQPDDEDHIDPGHPSPSI